MLIYATTIGPTEGARKGDVVRVLRVALRRVEPHVRRVDVRLITTRERPTCSVRVTFTFSRSLAIEEAAESLSFAFDAALDKLNEAIDSRLMGPFHRRRHRAARSLPFGRRGASTPSRQRAQPAGSTLDRARRESPRGSSGHRVLVALPQLAYPRLFPARSKLLAAALASDLHVFKVLSDKSTVASVRPGMNAERVLLGERKTRAWCKTVLGTQPPEAHVRVGIGDFVPAVIARATALDAALIVLPHSGHEVGATAVRLALGAFRPVLVARPLASRNTLLAALDLDDEHHPVLEAAEALATELDASLVALHNADLDASSSSAGADGPRQTEHVFHPARRTRAAASSRATTILLTRDEDTARAILTEARVHNVNTILVGARPPSCLDRVPGQDVVARVVDQANRSVLIMPLAAPEYGADFAPGSQDLH